MAFGGQDFKIWTVPFCPEVNRTPHLGQPDTAPLRHRTQVCLSTSPRSNAAPSSACTSPSCASFLSPACQGPTGPALVPALCVRESTRTDKPWPSFPRARPSSCQTFLPLPYLFRALAPAPSSPHRPTPTPPYSCHLHRASSIAPTQPIPPLLPSACQPQPYSYLPRASHSPRSLHRAHTRSLPSAPSHTRVPPWLHSHTT